ncbi:MAG: NAD(P)H-quinone oxidoreductase subunit F, partial [Hydrococcus sp. Prado102]|nr:NAD(P)H-quinone oxidoreductase subunit F [Hydrococcus sp. Prado102]
GGGMGVSGGAGLVALMPMGMFWTWQRWFNGAWRVNWWLLGVLLFVNLFSALNLTRVFRLVFLGQSQSKTRRAPEVAWPMALPMVALTIIVLLTPLIPIRWSLWLSPTTPFANSNLTISEYATPLLMISGLVGFILGANIELRRAWARPTQFYQRFFQDLLAYDFYLDKIYNYTVVWTVATLAKLSSWFDRYVIDGMVNFVSLATVFGGNALKYNVSGQSQFYVLTILLGVSFLLWFALSGQWSTVFDYWSSLLN